SAPAKTRWREPGFARQPDLEKKDSSPGLQTIGPIFSPIKSSRGSGTRLPVEGTMTLDCPITRIRIFDRIVRIIGQQHSAFTPLSERLGGAQLQHPLIPPSRPSPRRREGAATCLCVCVC